MHSYISSFQLLLNTYFLGKSLLTVKLKPEIFSQGVLRAAVRKYRLGVCKMKKSKIPKLCQIIGLGKLFLEK